jgi:hypothetical protein
MKTISTHTLIAATLICLLAMTAYAANFKIEKKQQDIRTMSQNTLQTLYKANPEAQGVVEKAAGYAVFSNLGVKILIAGSGNGKGMAVDNKNKREIFMRSETEVQRWRERCRSRTASGCINLPTRPRRSKSRPGAPNTTKMMI